MYYKLIRSARKTLSVEILRDGSFLVRAPRYCSIRLIENFLAEKEELLMKKREESFATPPLPSLSAEELNEMKRNAEKQIFPRVDFWSERTGFTHSGAKSTLARGRFGSCSGKNRLCFSAFLMLAEPEEIDYVILHELCHTIEHNHSAAFYALGARFMPDWKRRQAKLRKIIIPEIRK